MEIDCPDLTRKIIAKVLVPHDKTHELEIHQLLQFWIENLSATPGILPV